MAKKLRICETVLRDGHQSILATRMRYEQMEPVLGLLDEIGYEALECWGGATYDSCLRFLNEDPWERLRKLKSNLKNTPLQMLLRGQNLLGYKHYSDDVVEAFCNAAVKNGIDRIRIFDALNDPRNMEAAIKYSKKAGAHVQSAMVYTISPVHTTESFLKVAETLVEMGTDSLCIKDMSGLLGPADAYDLVSTFKKRFGELPIDLHSHFTCGLASTTMPRVREDLGYPPLVTPTSQIVGTMAMMNVMMGDRYKMVPNEVKDLVRGKYGALPGTISDEIRHTIIGDEEPITCRPADLIEPELEGYRQDLASKGYNGITDEDVLTYAMFPEVAINFFDANRR